LFVVVRLHKRVTIRGRQVDLLDVQLVVRLHKRVTIRGRQVDLLDVQLVVSYDLLETALLKLCLDEFARMITHLTMRSFIQCVSALVLTIRHSLKVCSSTCSKR